MNTCPICDRIRPVPPVPTELDEAFKRVVVGYNLDLMDRDVTLLIRALAVKVFDDKAT